eukprot:GILI01003635.1.p1 GENE.GILI01003635.1~~GILI01003635.1.p1  ORF type:complete len:114 (-),score=9.48 GILI01003635.1:383-724(-)
MHRQKLLISNLSGLGRTRKAASKSSLHLDDNRGIGNSATALVLVNNSRLFANCLSKIGLRHGLGESGLLESELEIMTNSDMLGLLRLSHVLCVGSFFAFVALFYVHSLGNFTH